MPYKILTLDGGGAWALIEVMALIEMFGANARGNNVLQKFDMVAANSGGSIVLGGLVENLTLQEMLDLFMVQANRQAIFSPTASLGDKVLEGLLHLGPKYSTTRKLAALQNLMPQTGKTPIANITAAMPGPAGRPVHLMIVGFDYDQNRATFFRSTVPAVPCLGVANPGGITMADAIHASTNAPINYFDGPAQFPNLTQRYWDGGVSGYNNPVLAAVTEAIVLGTAPDQIAALSLGTGTLHLPAASPGDPPSPFTTPHTNSNLVNDLTKMASSILDDPPDSASFIAHVMTKAGAPPAGAVSRIVRLNPVVSAAPGIAPPQPPANCTVEAFQFLCGIGMDAVKSEEVDAITAYANLWLQGDAPNQLLHSDNVNPATDLGQSSFAEARGAWKALTGM